MNYFIIRIDFVELSREKHGMIKCGIKSAVLVNSSPFNLYPGKFFIPGLRCFVSGLIKGLLSHLSAQVKLRLFQTDE